MLKFANSQMLLEFTVQIKMHKFTNALSNYFKVCSDFSIEFSKKVKRPFILQKIDPLCSF